MNKLRGILWGLAIIAAGILWGLSAAGILTVKLLFDGWWTLFIIVPSIIGLITDKNKTFSLITLIIGCILLASNYADMKLVKALIFPAIVVVIGFGILFNNISSRKQNDEFIQTAPGSTGFEEYSATFAQQNLHFTDEFRGGKFSAVFGSIRVDLRQAVIRENINVTVSATFGGVEIFVPNYVKVVSKSNSIVGGTTDKSNKNLPADAPTIFINAQNTFGGTEIKLN